MEFKINNGHIPKPFTKLPTQSVSNKHITFKNEDKKKDYTKKLKDFLFDENS